MGEADKEIIRQRATFINSIASAIFTVGVLTPILALIINSTADKAVIVISVLTAFVCFALCFVLHLRASEHLKELDQ